MEGEYLASKLSVKINLMEAKQLAALTLSKDISMIDLFSLCLHPNQQIAFRASWVLENVVFSAQSGFKKNIPQFLEAYPNIQNLSVKRHFTKIMMMLCKENLINALDVHEALLQKCLTATFDWLLNPNTPLAVQCNTLDLVFYFSKKENWILDELKVILEQNLISNSPALRSRSKRLLKRINLMEKQNLNND